jgi:anti-anti-sigma factor
MAANGTGEEGEQPFVVHSADSGDRGCHLTLRGEIDMASAPQVQQAVDEAVGRGRNQVSIDAADVTFIDSSALMALLTAQNEVVDSGGSLHLTDASPQVIRVLHMTMLADVLVVRSGDEPSGEGTPPGD